LVFPHFEHVSSAVGSVTTFVSTTETSRPSGVERPTSTPRPSGTCVPHVVHFQTPAVRSGRINRLQFGQNMVGPQHRAYGI
jgi:hypothetical protein